MGDKPTTRDAESIATEYRRAYNKQFNMNSDAGVDEIMAMHKELGKAHSGTELRNAVIAKMKEDHPESPMAGNVASRGEHTMTQQDTHNHDQAEVAAGEEAKAGNEDA